MSILSELEEIFKNESVTHYFFHGEILDSNSLDCIKEQGLTHELINEVGGVNQGLDYYVVVKFTKDGESQLVKFFGQYHSYVGAEYVGYSFVEAKVKKVVVYE